VDKGDVTAKVQGSRPKPYDIHIKVKTLSGADWKKLAKTLSGQALFAAKLLAGEMPQDIEETFKDTGLSLFPEALKDLETECSCPDWSNPCKHIAAVYYLLGEEFDRDPFLLFKLRGMTRQELVGLLGATGDKVKKPGSKSNVRRKETSEDASPLLEPLPCEGRAFWEGDRVPVDAYGEVRPPVLAAALPKRLGIFPFWRADEPFLDAMERVYQGASPIGLEVFLGGQQAAIG
jgi:uncharacterized Zn finger protein